MESLPLHLFYRIKEYSSYSEYISLMNTSKRNFQPIKYQTVYYSLNYVLSKDYLNSATFQEYVCSKVRLPSKQIGLCLNTVIPALLAYQGGMRKLNLQLCDVSSSLEALRDIAFLRIRGNSLLKSLSGLQEGVLKLHVIEFSALFDLSHLTSFSTLRECRFITCVELRDVSPLAHVASIHLEGCSNLKDVSPLRNVQSLSLIACDLIRDVSALGNIPELKIARCPLIRNIEALTNNKTLSINSFDGKHDFSLLSRVQNLSLASCKYLHHLSFFLEARTLSIGKCPNLDQNQWIPSKVTSLRLEDQIPIFMNHALQQLQKLELAYCSSVISGVNLFGDIPHLVIEQCRGAISLHGLGKPKQQVVHIKSCEDIRDFTPLQSINKVIIDNCRGFAEAAQVKDVKDLTVVNCRGLRDVAPLQNVQTLKLHSCQGVSSVVGLGEVENLYLLYLYALVDIRGIGIRNKKIVFPVYPNVLNIATLDEHYSKEVTRKYEVYLRKNDH